MGGQLVIRRLRIAARAPRDHPAPLELEARLKEAARVWLGPSLAQVLASRPSHSVVRVRRLDIDLSVDAPFDPESFATLLARGVARSLDRLEATASRGETHQTSVVFATPANYLAALVEALAQQRAQESWWFRHDAEGLRFLAKSPAIRTALLADPAQGEAALCSLPPRALWRVVEALSSSDERRVLERLVTLRAGASTAGECVEIIGRAAREVGGGAGALALYARAVALNPSLGGVALAAISRSWVEIARNGSSTSPEWIASTLSREALQRRDSDAGAEVESFAEDRVVGGRGPSGPCVTVPRGESTAVFTRFAGLLLLVPTLDLEELMAVIDTWPNRAPDTAALVAYTVFGLCGGRDQLGSYLGESIWRVLFGLDPRAAVVDIRQRLGRISAAEWDSLGVLGLRPTRWREARFLMPPRALLDSEDGTCSRVGIRTLAALAQGVYCRFARRLNGLRSPSAPFLCDRMLSAGGMLESTAQGWVARLSRPALDVLLSLSRLAEGAVSLPGGHVHLDRVAP